MSASSLWRTVTTQYDDPSGIEQSVWDMVIDWLAAELIRARPPCLSSPGTGTRRAAPVVVYDPPLGWLEHIPTYKDQQEKLREKDLATYGFLGYLLQTADILMYRAARCRLVLIGYPTLRLPVKSPVGLTTSMVAKPGFEEQAEAAIVKMGKERNLKKRYQEEGDFEELETAGLLKNSRTFAG